MNKKNVIIGVVFIAALGGSFAAGRFTMPAKVVTIEKQVEVIKEVVKTEIQVVEKKVYVRGEDRDVVREVVVIKRPDGTEETRTTETDRSRIIESSSQESSSQSTQVAEREKTVEVEKTKLVEAYKQWHIGVSAGGGARFIGELTPQLVFGVTVERRIVGPFFMGVNVSTGVGIKPGAAPPIGPPVTVTGSLVLALEF